jgi:hypothetical protein
VALRLSVNEWRVNFSARRLCVLATLRKGGCCAQSLLPEGGAVEVGVQVAGAGDFDAGDAFGLGQGVGDFLGDDPWGFFQALGQLEADRRRGFAHFDFGRAVDYDVQSDAVGLLDVARQSVAKAIGQG